MERPGARKFQQIVFVALWTLPILVALYLVWRHTVAFPFWDEWNTPGAQLASWYRGTLTFAELCSQHNESRKLVPRLIYLPLFTIAGWDVRLILPLVLGVVVLISVGLYQLARRTIRSGITACLAFTAMNFLLFSPREYQNFTNGIQWETFFPGLALVLTLLVNLSARSLAWKTVCNGLLALISTYTFANGMLVWPLAFPIATGPRKSSRSQIFWRLAYVIGGAVLIACYFISYRHPQLSPPAASLISDTPALLRFFLTWMGSLFRVANPVLAGGLVVAFFLVLAAISGWLAIKQRQWRTHYPWLILGTYTLISGAITAVARLGFGLTMATDTRYVVFSVMLYIATVGLGFTIYEKLPDRGNLRRLAQFVAAITGLVILALWASTFTAERRKLKEVTEYRTHLQWILRWADALPQNPELAWESPYPETSQIIHTLHEHDALRPRLVSESLARAVNEAPGVGDESSGALEQAVPDGNGRLWVKGWARAGCVVLGLQTGAKWAPRWVVETGAGAGFRRPLLMGDVAVDGMTIKAWAIDLKTDRAFPLAGEIKLQP